MCATCISQQHYSRFTVGAQESEANSAAASSDEVVKDGSEVTSAFANAASKSSAEEQAKEQHSENDSSKTEDVTDQSPSQHNLKAIEWCVLQYGFKKEPCQKYRHNGMVIAVIFHVYKHDVWLDLKTAPRLGSRKKFLRCCGLQLVRFVGLCCSCMPLQASGYLFVDLAFPASVCVVDFTCTIWCEIRFDMQ